MRVYEHKRDCAYEHIKTMGPARCNLRAVACAAAWTTLCAAAGGKVCRRPHHANCSAQAALFLCVYLQLDLCSYTRTRSTQVSDLSADDMSTGLVVLLYTQIRRVCTYISEIRISKLFGFSYK